MKRGSVAIAVLLLATSATSATGARAQNEPAKVDNRARAQELFDSALSDAEKGDFATACPKFLASQTADPKASTLLNLANCYEKNGQTASAWGAFREAESLARKAGHADWENAAHARAEALEPKLVRLTVDVPESSRVPGLVVTRDGAKLAAGEYGVGIPVDPGEHVIAASADGRKPFEQKVVVRESSGAITVPGLEELPAPPPAPIAPPPIASPPPPPPPSWWTPLRTAGVISGGAGAAAMVTGVVLGLVAKSSYDDALAQCTNGTRGCPAGAVSDANGAYGLAAGATAVFVIGAVAAAAGGALVIFGGPKVEVGVGSVAGRF
ncbi:MAG TPA: hypothetical protein VIF62_18245 [Labilithrix sp.]